MDRTFWIALLAALVVACGDGATGPTTLPAPPTTETVPEAAPGACDDRTFNSTFDAIEEIVFARHGCTAAVCHGDAAAGGLSLAPGLAYDSLFGAPSTGSSFLRVEPGDRDRSYLYLKLAAKTDPGSVEITGSAMPSGRRAIHSDELEAVRLWIYAGAPRTGVVIGTESLLDACLPEPEPIDIAPLPPPEPGDGLQFVLPTVHLPATSEQEICFAFYYDVSDQVPDVALDPTGEMFRIRTQEIRQDPQSHHILLLDSGVDVTQIHDPAFGGWRCHGGPREGEACEPTDLESCPNSLCRSELRNDLAGCVGYGLTSSADIVQRGMGGAQEPQAWNEFPEGIFAQYPVRGIAYWNSHAFNLTSKDAGLNGRINFYFAEQQDIPIRNVPVDLVNIFRPNAAPFEEETLCADYVVPQGTRFFLMSSHTHKRGKHFWAELPDGTLLYENFIYNDPTRVWFDPPLAFDSEDPAQRTIHYCARYENGIGTDGEPDPELVTRASRIPASALATVGACSPVACVAGNLGAPCDGVDDDAACDSSPGAGDGWCDACAITGGESTENEMFLLTGQWYIATGFPQPPLDGPVYAGAASVR